jgi:chitodextrinase
MPTYDAAGNRSPKTTVDVATSPCLDTTPPSTPIGLTASNLTQTSLTLNWNASTDNVGVAGYDLYDNGSKSGSATSTSFNFGNLTCGTSHTLGVVAYDAAGNRSSLAKCRLSSSNGTAAVPSRSTGRRRIASYTGH